MPVFTKLTFQGSVILIFDDAAFIFCGNDLKMYERGRLEQLEHPRAQCTIKIEGIALVAVKTLSGAEDAEPGCVTAGSRGVFI